MKAFWLSCLLLFGGFELVGAAELPEVVVYKSPTCGCCGKWEDHLRQQGFRVVSRPTEQMGAVKAQLGVPGRLHSCHTALVGDYLVEGHVPAQDILRLVKEKPAVRGLTAPGMPQRSPGMQPEGLPPSGYDVLSFDAEGKTAVFSRY